MRYAFFITVIALLELFSLGAVLSLQWWLQPWLTPNLRLAVWVIMFAMTNGLLIISVSKRFANSYRWVSAWILVMHYMIVTALTVALAFGGYLLVDLLFDLSVSESLVSVSLRVSAAVVFIGLFIYSLYYAYSPVVRKLSIGIDKPMATPFTIAMVSDLHLGELFGNRAIDKLQHIINKHQPEALLMPGDIMDDNIKAYTAHKMAEGLTKLCASLPFGVYATLGNHDLYGHEQPISQALRSAGVHLLNDEVFCLDYAGQPVWLIGRFDNHKRERVATTELVAKVNTDEPVILLDHRPSDIMAHSKLPIDLQVSGHTHNGQIFPANFIVNAINRVGYGYEAIGQGHFVVSSGYGFWGIPFRLGSRSEVWLITVSSS